MQNEHPKEKDDISGGERNLVGTSNQDWKLPDHSMVTVERKAVNTAGNLFGTVSQQTGLSIVREDQLDGPVFSTLTIDEDEVGQYADYSASSGEFECDRDSFTSLTDNSME